MYQLVQCTRERGIAVEQVNSLQQVADRFKVTKYQVRKWKDEGCVALQRRPYRVDAIAQWLQDQPQYRNVLDSGRAISSPASKAEPHLKQFALIEDSIRAFVDVSIMLAATTFTVVRHPRRFVQQHFNPPSDKASTVFPCLFLAIASYLLTQILVLGVRAPILQQYPFADPELVPDKINPLFVTRIEFYTSAIIPLLLLVPLNWCLTRQAERVPNTRSVIAILGSAAFIHCVLLAMAFLSAGIAAQQEVFRAARLVCGYGMLAASVVVPTAMLYEMLRLTREKSLALQPRMTTVIATVVYSVGFFAVMWGSLVGHCASYFAPLSASNREGLHTIVSAIISEMEAAHFSTPERASPPQWSLW